MGRGPEARCSLGRPFQGVSPTTMSPKAGAMSPKVYPQGFLSVQHTSAQSTFEQENKKGGTSLVAQWLRIRLPTQGTRAQALVREDPTCRGATKPTCHNY